MRPTRSLAPSDPKTDGQRTTRDAWRIASVLAPPRPSRERTHRAAGVCEQAHEVRATVLRGEVQRHEPARRRRCARVGGSATPEQRGGGRDVASLHGLVQRRAADRVGRADVRAALDQRRRRVRVRAAHREPQRRRAVGRRRVEQQGQR